MTWKAEKMVRRHPWVFGDMEIDSIDENVSLWEQIKKKVPEDEKALEQEKQRIIEKGKEIIKVRKGE